MLERKLDCNKTKDEFNVCKENLYVIYDEIAISVKIKNRGNLYELGEKSNKLFLNLKKYRINHNIIRKVIHNAQEVTDNTNINNHIFSLCKKLFQKKSY